MRIFGAEIGAVAVTLGVASAGGLAAWWLRLPLGFLLGALVVTALLAAGERRLFGHRMTLPLRLRQGFVPVIGVSIGGAFTPQVVGGMGQWWPSLLALLIYIPAAHALAYAIYRRGGIGPREAFFGGIPGGLIESVSLGEEMGADIRILTALQFLRLILTIVSVPLIFLALTGSRVGSAAGVSMGGGVTPGPVDWLVLAAAGVAGFWLAARLRFPAPMMTGPLLLSAVAHATGLAQGAPPVWLVSVTQVVVGAGLGARFGGMDRAMLARTFGLAVLNGTAALILAFGFALGLHTLIDEPVTAIFLAFAPGGVAEMSLIALSLNIGVVYVTVHHVVRIVLAVTIARIGSRRLR
ncbi:MAG: AbrB family transcriptional regulator [Paracoccaceae bacterium]